MAKKNNNIGRKVTVGAGVVAALAAAAGAYFLTGERGKKNREKIKGWTLKMKGEVMERMEKMGDITEKQFKRVVDDVAKRYRALKSVDNAELARLAAEIKSHWDAISKEVRGAVPRPQRERSEAGGRGAKKKTSGNSGSKRKASSNVRRGGKKAAKK